MTGNHRLAERILDSFPAGTYAITGLLRLMDIRETTRVETAAVECSSEPRLLINPEFADRWARTPEHLFVLVLHEIHHVLLGQTRLFPRVTVVDNFVFDAVINAMICRMFPGPEFTSFFRNFYSGSNFPACLLRPPEDWSPDKAAELPTKGGHDPGVRAVYSALYSERGASYEDLYDLLKSLLREEDVSHLPLLGHHQETPDLPVRSPLIFDAVRKIVERWPQPPDPLRGRSLNSILSDERVPMLRRPSFRRCLRRLLETVAGIRGSDGASRLPSFEDLAIETPVFQRDRRSIVRSALGQPVLLYRGRLRNPRHRPSGDRVHVYLDVSGSIGDLKGPLYRAVLDCRSFVFPRIHLFSTRVEDISLAELRRGVCRTTWGTSIQCVADDIRKERIRRAVVITDGCVGRLSGILAETLLHTKLGVALTPGFSRLGDLAGFADWWIDLGLESGTGGRVHSARGRGRPSVRLFPGKFDRPVPLYGQAESREAPEISGPAFRDMTRFGRSPGTGNRWTKGGSLHDG